MHRPVRIAVAVILLVTATAVSAAPASIVFIDPGRSDEAYWQMVCGTMSAAARQFGTKLEIVHAERDHFRQIKLAQDIAARKDKPDFVICVNEKQVAPQTIAPLDQAGIKTLLILNDLTDEQKNRYGRPRGGFKGWLGTIVPDNVLAGRLIARELFAALPRDWQRPVGMVAINGLLATPAAAERQEGLKEACAGRNDIELHQVVNTNWTEQDGYDRAKGLLSRYTDLRVIWCGNDPVALGAVKAVRDAGKVPGRDVLVAGLNWSAEALGMVEKGELTATVGGHFLVGAWAIVVISDYAAGHDFASSGTEIRLPGFAAVNSVNIARFRSTIGTQAWDRIDFRSFARSATGAATYDFSLERLIARFR